MSKTMPLSRIHLHVATATVAFFLCGVRAETDGNLDIVLDEEFGPECVGRSMKDWTNPFRSGLRSDESYVRLEDGMMKVFLGRGWSYQEAAHYAVRTMRPLVVTINARPHTRMPSWLVKPWLTSCAGAATL